MSPKHPRLAVEPTSADHFMNGVALAGLLLSWALVLMSWSGLPDSVPRHFGFSGEPDAWGHRGLLFLLPSIGLFQCIILVAIQRIPHSFNYPWPITPENASVQYRRAIRLIQLLNLMIQWFFCAVVWETIQIANGAPTTLLYVLTPLFLIAIFSLIIGYLIFGKRNATQTGGSP